MEKEKTKKVPKTRKLPANQPTIIPTTSRGDSRWIIPTILALVAALVLIVVFWVDSPVDTNVYSTATITCIASEAKLYTSMGCSYCEKQKKILGDDLELFSVTECRDNPEVCVQSNIQVIPTWIIDDKDYAGVRSLEELKELTGC